MITLHFATGARGEFGYKGKLPWGSIPNELGTFWKGLEDRAKPTHILMGSNTFNSLPASANARLKRIAEVAVVDFPRDELREEHVSFLQSTLDMLGKDARVAVIGGAYLLDLVMKEYLNEVTEMYISVINSMLVNPKTMSFEGLKADTFLDMAHLNYIFDNYSHRRTIVAVEQEFTSLIMELK